MSLPRYNDLTERGRVIHKQLQDVYARNDRNKGEGSFTFDANVSLAERLDKYLSHDLDSHRYDSKQEFINIIWMTWAGGSTAEHVANRILLELGVSLDNDDG